VGVLLEDPPCYPFLSGEGHLTWAARSQGTPVLRVPEVLHLVGLEEAAGKHASAYSMGMRQRLGLALALLNDPDLLILDEPTNGLDPQGIADFRALLERLRDEGKTVLLSSHLLSEVERVSDRIAVMRDGRIVASSDVTTLRGRPMVVLRATPMDTATGIAKAAEGVTVLSADAAALHVEGSSESIPALVRDLVLSGVAVHEVRHETQSIETVVLPLLDGDAQ
jgi:ABC-2 type transport system ATP-binding protein